MTRFVTIDFTNILPPDIVETLDFEVILAALKADFVTRHPQFDVAVLESEPIVALLQTAAYRETKLRARVNDAAKAVMAAHATGADLDNLAALYKFKRADGQSDESLRKRMHEQIEAFASAGPVGAYVHHAKAAAPTLIDANAVHTAPGEVSVVLLGETDGVPTAEEIEAVKVRLARDDIRPLTDMVTVVPATMMPVFVKASLVLLPGPDAALVLEKAQAALSKELAERRRIGRNLSRSAIFDALQVEGVERVILTEPATEVIVGPAEAVRIGSVNLSIASERDE